MCRVTENGQKSENSISIDLYHKLKGILPQKVLPLEAPAPPLEVPYTPPLEVRVLPLEVAGDKL